MINLMLNITNHELNTGQISELYNADYQVADLPEELQKLWGNVSPETVDEITDKIMVWALEMANKTIMQSAPEGHWDYPDFEVDLKPEEVRAVVQGHFGATYSLIEKLYSRGIIPVYADSKRLIEENPDGSITKRFVHNGFYYYSNNHGFLVYGLRY